MLSPAVPVGSTQNDPSRTPAFAPQGVDATIDGRPAGTVRVLEPRFASDFPRSLGAHDIGLRDLVAAAVGAFIAVAAGQEAS